jgi:hypothetical protein
MAEAAGIRLDGSCQFVCLRSRRFTSEVLASYRKVPLPHASAGAFGMTACFGFWLNAECSVLNASLRDNRHSRIIGSVNCGLSIDEQALARVEGEARSAGLSHDFDCLHSDDWNIEAHVLFRL